MVWDPAADAFTAMVTVLALPFPINPAFLPPEQAAHEDTRAAPARVPASASKLCACAPSGSSRAVAQRSSCQGSSLRSLDLQAEIIKCSLFFRFTDPYSTLIKTFKYGNSSIPPLFLRGQAQK